jgi:hypothetical protein
MMRDLAALLQEAATQRAAAVRRALGTLTAAEAGLLREAAVMGYVQGVEAAKAGEVAIPPDGVVVALVVAEAARLRLLYPVIGAAAEGRRFGDERVWPDVPNWRDIRTGSERAWREFADRHGIPYPRGSTRARVATNVRAWLERREAADAADVPAADTALLPPQSDS